MEPGNARWALNTVLVVEAFLAVALIQSSAAAEGQTNSPTRVYQCTKEGVQVFSDHPCGPDAQARDVAVTNRMDTIKTNTAAASRNADSQVVHHSARHRETEAGASTEQRCKKISSDKAAIDSRMRTGYSAAQGERLRERLRKLNDAYFELRCSRYG